MNIVIKLLTLITFVSCTQERLIVDGALEPPAPGFFEKDATLLGVDSNENGIRDDVERFINREYKTANFRNAARQYAFAAQKIMRQGLSQKRKREFVQELMLGTRCFRAFTYKIEASEYSKSLVENVFNTSDRDSKYKDATKTLNGSLLRYYHTYEDRVKGCNFDVTEEI